MEECGEVDTVCRRLVDPARRVYPDSSNVTVLVIHLAWDQLMAWARDRSKLETLLDIVWSLWSVASPQLRLQYLSLIWRTHYQELVRDCAKLTDSLSKSVGVNREAKCQDVLQMKPEHVAIWLNRWVFRIILF